jgi:hypothetical protein
LDCTGKTLLVLYFDGELQRTTIKAWKSEICTETNKLKMLQDTILPTAKVAKVQNFLVHI